MWKKAVNIKFKLLCLHINEGNEKNFKNYCMYSRSQERHLNMNLFDRKRKRYSADKDAG